MAEAQENQNVEEQEEEECPKCPPPGAPAWMATFADMATLLMAFFVLILSFAEFNVPKFKQISGSLKNAFGIQRVVPVVEQPRGTTVLALNFSPSPEPSVTKNMTQQSTNTEQKNLDLKSEEDKRESSKSSSDNIEKAKKLEEALKSKYIDDYIVSTDCKEIANVANKFGAETPFLRPPEYSTDEASSLSAIIHAIEFMENAKGIKYDFFIELMCTNPLKNAYDIDSVILHSSNHFTFIKKNGPMLLR